MKLFTLWRRKLVLFRMLRAAVLIHAGWKGMAAPRMEAQLTHQKTSKVLDSALEGRICTVVRATKRYIGQSELYDGCQIEAFSSATGDGAKTMLIDVGELGAYTDAIVVYRLDHGVITVGKFKTLKGEVEDSPAFAEGSSAMNYAYLKLSAGQQTLFTVDGENNEDTSAVSCKVHAYQWIHKLRMFVERAPRKTDEVRCDIRRPGSIENGFSENFD